MDLNLNNKIALICGASKGLGYATATEFSKEGATVLICSSDEQRINQAADEIRIETGNKVFPFKADLADEKQIDALVDSVLSQFNYVDILVNNTGGPPTGFFMDFTEQEWLAAYKLTFLSVISLSKQLIPKMVERQWGRIINLTSISVKQPIDTLIISNSIRMSIIGWAKTISNQYANDGITINNIATGYTFTERVINLADNIAKNQNISPDQVINSWIEKIPAGRLAQPEEIAWMAAFLASGKASYITGTTIPVDGGFVQSML